MRRESFASAAGGRGRRKAEGGRRKAEGGRRKAEGGRRKVMNSRTANHSWGEQIRKPAGSRACTDVSRWVKSVLIVPRTSCETEPDRELTTGETTARLKSRSGAAAERRSGASRRSVANFGVSAMEKAELLIGDYSSVAISGNRREFNEMQRVAKGRSLSSARPPIKAELLMVSTRASQYRGVGGSRGNAERDEGLTFCPSATPAIKAELLMVSTRASQYRGIAASSMKCNAARKGRTLSSATPAIKAELPMGDDASVATSENWRESMKRDAKRRAELSFSAMLLIEAESLMTTRQVSQRGVVDASSTKRNARRSEGLKACPRRGLRFKRSY
jgi:hypothetical protein